MTKGIKMLLQGEVVKVQLDSFTDKTTGEQIPLYRAYLKSGDPLAGAMEIALVEETFNQVKEGSIIEFVPTFSTRTWNRNTIVTAKVVSDFKVIKVSKKAE